VAGGNAIAALPAVSGSKVHASARLARSHPPDWCRHSFPTFHGHPTVEMIRTRIIGALGRVAANIDLNLQ
jgi:hypothetical protein